MAPVNPDLSVSATSAIVVTIVTIVLVVYFVAVIIITLVEMRTVPAGNLNMPKELYDNVNAYYIVTVATGLRCGAGVGNAGIVKITLRGSSANSIPMKILNPKDVGMPKLLNPGRVDRFLLPAQEPLGEVQKVDIDLYSLRNDQVNWYVKYIRVMDVKFGVTNSFLFDRWVRTQAHLRTGVHTSKLFLYRDWFERFLDLYLDMHIWASIYNHGCEVTAFSRFLHASLCAMTFSCIMLANLLICIIPEVQHVSNEEANSLMRKSLIYGFLGNLIAMSVQYVFEFLLRNVRSPSDHQLISEKSNWKRKPLPRSMYPEIDHDVDHDMDADIVPLIKRPPTSTKKRTLASIAPTIPSLNQEFIKVGRTIMPAKSYLLESGTSLISEKSVSTQSAYSYVSRKSFRKRLNRNKNSNKEVPKVETKEDVNELIKAMLWDLKCGVISKYILNHENVPKYQKKNKGSGEKIFSLKGLAKYLVLLVLDESKKTRISEFNEGKRFYVARIQDDFYEKLNQKCSRNCDQTDLIHCLQSERESRKVNASHTSEGHITNKRKPKTLHQYPFITSSCPKLPIVKTNRSDKINHGPVVNQLSESITSIAFRHSFTSLQNSANDKLVSQSKMRISSFTSLVKVANLSDRTLIKASYSDTDQKYSSPKAERMNVKTLMDFISPSRAERLSEESMEYIAQASLRSLVSNEALQKLCRTAMDCHSKAMQSFTFDVVGNLCNIISTKLDDLVEVPLKKKKPDKNFKANEQIMELLVSADAEIRGSILPPLEEHILLLLRNQTKCFSDIAVDLVMMAFSEQYVDTVITNAVLHAYIGLLQAKQNIECLHFEEKEKYSQIQKEGESISMTGLEFTDEVKNIVGQLCEFMLLKYKEKKGCTVSHTAEVNSAMRATFVNLASTYDAFERVLTESISFLQLLSQHFDIMNVLANDKLMSRLADTFLASGFDVDRHATITADLSSNFLDKAIQHACVIVAEELIEPLLNAQTAELHASSPITINVERMRYLSKHANLENTKKTPKRSPKRNIRSRYTSAGVSQRITSDAQQRLYETFPTKLDTRSNNYETKRVGFIQKRPKYFDEYLLNINFSNSPAEDSSEEEEEEEEDSPDTTHLTVPTAEEEGDTEETAEPSEAESEPERSEGAESVAAVSEEAETSEPAAETDTVEESETAQSEPLEESTPAASEPAESEAATSEVATSEVATSEVATSEPAESEAVASEPATSEPAESEVATEEVSSDVANTVVESETATQEESEDTAGGGVTGHITEDPNAYYNQKLEQVFGWDPDRPQIFSVRGGHSGMDTLNEASMGNSDDRYDHLITEKDDDKAPVLSYNTDINKSDHKRLYQIALSKEVLGETGKWLNPFTQYIIHVFMLIVMFSTLLCCILFSLDLPNPAAVAWVVILLVSFLEHVIVFETLKVAGIAFYYVTKIDNEGH